MMHAVVTKSEEKGHLSATRRPHPGSWKSICWRARFIVYACRQRVCETARRVRGREQACGTRRRLCSGPAVPRRARRRGCL
eukprot:9729318-Lingulodinium_polyedra.AAC.1